MTLRMFLLSILTGSFALGPAIFLAMEYLEFRKRLVPKHRRLLVAGLSGVIGIGVWTLARWLGYIDSVDTLSTEYVLPNVWTYGVMTAFSAFTSATLIHGRFESGDGHDSGAMG